MPPLEPPLVVGISRPRGLARLAALPAAERVADLIEARLDLALPERVAPGTGAGTGTGTTAAAAPDLRAALAECRKIEETGTPVLVTVRLEADGGRWRGDADRLPLFEEALGAASWVDIEVGSAIAGAVTARARERGRKVVVSHHDFTGTPELGALEALCDRAAALGGDVVKIATRVETLADHHSLIELLRRRREALALAVVAMGPLGTSLRSYLPCVGSRLAYGFLDEPVAPGQISAEALVERLLSDCPAYAARR
jgi:3-dehydroquinate dehydratase-1